MGENIPLDIIELILKIAADDGSASAFNLLTISKEVYRWTRPVLFRNIAFTSVQNFIDFVHQFNSYDETCALVQSIFIKAVMPKHTGTQKEQAKAEQRVMSAWFTTAYHMSFKSLTHLAVEGAACAEMANGFLNQPSLRYMALTDAPMCGTESDAFIRLTHLYLQINPSSILPTWMNLEHVALLLQIRDPDDDSIAPISLPEKWVENLKVVGIHLKCDEIIERPGGNCVVQVGGNMDTMTPSKWSSWAKGAKTVWEENDAQLQSTKDQGAWKVYL